MVEQQTYNPYTLADIERYLQGKMSAAEMHAIEKAALQDPFLSDAIEGYGQVPFTVSRENLDSIAAALTGDKEDAKVIAMPVKKRGWISVAASVLAVAAMGIVAMLVFKKPANENASLAQANVAATKADTSAAQVNAPTALQQAESQKAIAQNTMPAKDKTVTAKTDESKAKDDVAYNALPPLTENAPVSHYDTIRATDDAGLAANKATYDFKAPAGNRVSGPAANQNNVANIQPPVLTKDNPEFRRRTDSVNYTRGYADVNANAAAATFAKPPAEALAKRKSSGLTIQLSPLPGFDSTITVTLLNNKSRQRTATTDTSLLPQGGWETFREYVARQQHKEVDSSDVAFEIEGDVELEFTVDERGLAQEIRIIKSLNEQSDRQAVEYVKNWPAWIATKNHKGKVVIQF